MEAEVVNRARAGDGQSGEMLGGWLLENVRGMLRARGYSGDLLDDMTGAGVAGAWRALRGFRASRGCSARTYFVLHCAFNAAMDEANKDSRNRHRRERAGELAWQSVPRTVGLSSDPFLSEDSTREWIMRHVRLLYGPDSIECRLVEGRSRGMTWVQIAGVCDLTVDNVRRRMGWVRRRLRTLEFPDVPTCIIQENLQGRLVMIPV